MKTNVNVVGACVCGALAIAGCGATAPVPTDKLARAQETVRIAESAPSASMDPTTAYHLQLAKGQLDHGKKLMIDGDNEHAKWALSRAQADAELAVYLAQAQAAKADARATLDAIALTISEMQQQEGH
jgi:hypothetical protein